MHRLSGDPRQALRTLVESSWRLIADAGAVLEAAQDVEYSITREQWSGLGLT
jgi:hypothetical protein